MPCEAMRGHARQITSTQPSKHSTDPASMFPHPQLKLQLPSASSVFLVDSTCSAQSTYRRAHSILAWLCLSYASCFILDMSLFCPSGATGHALTPPTPPFPSDVSLLLLLACLGWVRGCSRWTSLAWPCCYSDDKYYALPRWDRSSALGCFSLPFTPLLETKAEGTKPHAGETHRTSYHPNQTYIKVHLTPDERFLFSSPVVVSHSFTLIVRCFSSFTGKGKEQRFRQLE
ncbi:hypothetical protein M440DRAFT_1036984 [Trichoderma longibrachiatum ATCC 18648]|uniref:Uncharacterized protein n=1 Tax=Trichoderma longibrachiatum ATCC 18648 TaxID=983965 RepID=A0A2T4BZX6_TRILO|nr:hypothetical protein M440DRAFT_1036984 [Trichoderma longibrachiatum ATCC 18648]